MNELERRLALTTNNSSLISDLGKELGYPTCCIKEFIYSQKRFDSGKGATRKDKARVKAAHINGEFTGFIPCFEHAKKINNGNLKLEEIIKERKEGFPPFPYYAKH